MTPETGIFPPKFRELAFVSILNGVFLDVMPEITVSYALSGLSYVREADRYPGILGDLINFGFSKSGVSCLDKLSMFNAEKKNIIQQPEAAAALYNALKNELCADAPVIDGMLELLAALQTIGVRSFTTSVVAQGDLDRQMASSAQGKKLAPFLTKALGADGSYTKLLGHLRYIVEQHPEIKRFYLLFDAAAEVRMGKEAQSQFDSRVVGFAIPMSTARIQNVLAKANQILQRMNKYPFEPLGSKDIALQDSELMVPSLAGMQEDLLRAGSEKVVVYRDSASLKQVAEDLVHSVNS